jgi:hypothetical protein
MTTLPMKRPADRGRLMTPTQVAKDKFAGAVTARWVRMHVRPKVRLGHSTVMFYEGDVDAWIATRRDGAA